ncbi:unnamed protein product [Orchesella dallaii]|uniref:Uncharacterized protein n=1 Tax=Orchesella dallaii TaxID=48710 RepID=A0ABP1QNP1_9HEXA
MVQQNNNAHADFHLNPFTSLRKFLWYERAVEKSHSSKLSVKLFLDEIDPQIRHRCHAEFTADWEAALDFVADVRCYNFLGTTTNYKEGEYYWPVWHDQVKEVGNHYPRYVQIMNEAAILNGYQNAKQFYVRDYGSDVSLLNSKVQKIMGRIQPFYKQLYAYARRKLGQFYRDQTENQECNTSSDRMGRLRFQSTFLEICMHNDGTTFMTSSCLLELPKMDFTDEMVKQGNTIVPLSKCFNLPTTSSSSKALAFPL